MGVGVGVGVGMINKHSLVFQATNWWGAPARACQPERNRKAGGVLLQGLTPARRCPHSQLSRGLPPVQLLGGAHVAAALAACPILMLDGNLPQATLEVGRRSWPLF